MTPVIVTFLAGYATIALSEYIWLGHIVHQFIIREFGTLVRVENGAIDISIRSGIVAWFLIILGLLVFVILPEYSMKKTIGMGVLYGLVVYGIYDFTNLTFLADYSLKFTYVDMIWWGVLCGFVSWVMYMIYRMF